ncbi:MAG: T9SS type A sorting domain-containing protein, partial [Saprospiraceae bacterium]
NFTIEINAFQAGQMELRVYDVLGKELGDLNRQTAIDQGLSSIEIPAESLTAGLYYCSIKIDGQSFTKSFVRVDGK